MSGVHSKYSGSNAHRFLRCPGQVALAAQVPELPPVDDYAAEGDRAHRELERVLSGSDFSAGASYEMQEAVLDVLFFVNTLRSEHPDLIVLSEQYGPFPQSVVPEDQAGGTADVVAYSVAAQSVWIIDFKYGVGVTVDVEDNEQIKFYAACSVWRTAFKKLFGVIVQPRSFRGSEPRIVEISAVELVDFVAQIEHGIKLSEKPNAELVPGEHCHFCPCAGICPARDAKALAVISPEGRPLDALDPLVLPAPADLSMTRLGDILALKPMVEKWLGDVEKYAFASVMAGEQVPGQKVVEANARREYVERPGLEHSLAAGAAATTDAFLTMPKLIPLTDAEKLIVSAFKAKGQTAEQAKEWFAQFTIKKSSGKLTLAPIDDPRPAANRAKNDFAGIVPAPTGA
jgi:Protein of unknown function (DUF2800)